MRGVIRRRWTDSMVAILFCVLALASSRLSAGAKVETVGRHERSERGMLQGIPTLILRGTHAERGEAHGVLCAREIVAVIRGYVIPTAKAGSQAVTGQSGLDAYEKVIRPSMHALHWAPRFEEELAGILRGIRQALPDPKDRFLPELGRELDLKAWNTLADWSYQGCSSFAVWGTLTPDGQAVVGRNLDFPSSPELCNAHCLMAFVPDKEESQPILGVSFMGLIGIVTAMNQDGVFVSMHNVGKQVSSDKAGRVPRCLALREALEHSRRVTALADIPEALRRQPILVGNNIILSRPARRGPLALVLEWDGDPLDEGVTVRSQEQRDGANALFCTNHHLDRGGGKSDPGSVSRYAAMRDEIGRFLTEGRQVSSLDDARRVLARAAGPNTLHSVVVWPAARRWALAISPGEGHPAVEQPWVEFSWSDLMPAP